MTVKNASSLLDLAVFDSGVGALTVLEGILLEKSPRMQNYHLWLDEAGFPYGIRTEKDLQKRVFEFLHPLMEKFQPRILVVACNTVSTLILDELRKMWPHTAIVGVVPAIKPASQISKSGVIGLLATRATVERSYTKKLIEEFAGDKHVITIGSNLLVQLAEKKLRGHQIDLELIKTELAPFFQEPKLDTVVLACTHFPHLLEEFKAVCPAQYFWIDPSIGVAKRVAGLFDGLELKNSTHFVENSFISSKAELPEKFFQDLLKAKFSM